MSLDLKDYVFIFTTGCGSLMILKGLFHITGLHPTTIKKATEETITTGLVITLAFGAIDNIKPIRKEVKKELFPDCRDDDDGCSNF